LIISTKHSTKKKGDIIKIKTEGAPSCRGKDG